MAKHSALGASSAERWMACPGSVRLIGQLGDGAGTTSTYAAEGSAAHRVAELCLNGDHEAVEMAGRIVEGYEVTDEMVEAVQLYLDVVRTQRMLIGEGELMVEVPVDLTHLHPQLWGTLDTALYGRHRLVVIDFKYGRGVPVEVQANPQLRYYALGAWRLVPSTYRIEVVELILVQPRAAHRDGPVRSWEVGAAELVKFGDELVEAANRTGDPEAELRAGDWCRFCPAQATCPALRALAEQTALTVFQDSAIDIAGLTTDDLGVILERAPIIDSFIRAVEARALELAQAGVKIPGWKLVDKRAVRSWKDEAAAATALVALGAPQSDVYVTKLVSPAQAEKLLSAPARKALAPLIAKVSSGTTLAPDTDVRPEVVTGPLFEAEAASLF